MKLKSSEPFLVEGRILIPYPSVRERIWIQEVLVVGDYQLRSYSASMHGRWLQNRDCLLI
jgi:hypothetical protein